MMATIELTKLVTFCVHDVAHRFGDNMKDLEIIHCECSPGTSDSVIALKNKTHSNTDNVHVYTYDSKLDRLTYNQWTSGYTKYADNFAEQLEKAIVKKEGNSDE